MDRSNRDALAAFISEHSLPVVLGAIRDIAFLNALEAESAAPERPVAAC